MIIQSSILHLINNIYIIREPYKLYDNMSRESIIK